MELLDTLTKKKIKIKKTSEALKLYLCGMTVYDNSHIGHARSNIIFDALVRYLRSDDYSVKYVRNITDVDDKIINRSKDKKITPSKLTQEIIGSINSDFDSLNLLKPDNEPLVSKNIEYIQSVISELLVKSYAYISESGDILFDVSHKKDYGKLSNQKLENLNSDKLDFALWKKTEDKMFNSPWGKGRPGWHIECSSLIKKYLGDTIDIHGAGMDLKFPHNENEVAQSEALTGKPLSKVWFHIGILKSNGEKMSKSLKNFILIKDLLSKYNVEVIRYYFTNSHYRSILDYNENDLKAAKNTVEKIYSNLLSLQSNHKKIADDNIAKDIKKEFIDSLNNDFNTPKAISVLFRALRHANENKETNFDKAVEYINLLKDLANKIGLFITAPNDFFEKSKKSISEEELTELMRKRNQARKDKDFKTSDKIRDKLNKLGIKVSDKEI